MSDPQAIVNDTFHGKDVQLDGYSVTLTVKNVRVSDCNVSYRLQLSYGASQTVQYTVLLESASKYSKKKIKTTIYQQQHNQPTKQTNKNNNDKRKRKAKYKEQYCTWLQMIRFLPLIHNLEFYVFSQFEKKKTRSYIVFNLMVTTHIWNNFIMYGQPICAKITYS